VNVAIRVDASKEIGSGHVMRCLVLAKNLRAAGVLVTFVCREHACHLGKIIKEDSFNLILMPLNITRQFQLEGMPFNPWLGASEAEDASDFAVAIEKKNINVIIVDHYAIGTQWERGFYKNHKIMVIDDLADRKHQCHLLLDQNIWRDQNDRYTLLVDSKAVQLLGPEYALLRNEFHSLKVKKLLKNGSILAFFGGSDPTNESQKLLEAAIGFESYPFDLIVIVGLMAGFDDTLQEILPRFIKILRSPDNYEEILATSIYAFGASGSSNWERFCLEIPTTLVSIADNQVELANYLNELGVVKYLGDGRNLTVTDYRDELDRIAKEPSLNSFNQVINVDGKGAEKVAREVLQLC
jgi:UDP-2,4-diacetamido-2,4,6-trideoxy-beta-L-altropyranose hydrolase